MRGERGEIVAVRVRGIDPDRIGDVTDLREDLRPGSEGALDALRADAGRRRRARPGLIVGERARQPPRAARSATRCR